MKKHLYTFLILIAYLPTSLNAQQFYITGASVDTSKVRITDVKQRKPETSPTAPMESTNERTQPFYQPRPAPQGRGGTPTYGTYSSTPPPIETYAPKAKKGILITNDMGVDKPKKPKNINISSVRGLAQACQHVISAQNGRSYDERSYGLCYGYMRGVKNSYDIQNKTTKKGKICFPRNVTWLQIIKVYLKWVDRHPEKLHRIAWEGTIQAMKSAFACPPGR